MSTDATPRLGLPWLIPAQAQKHVTVNESLGKLDMMIAAAAISRSVADQPADPSEGDAYILPAAPNGASWAQFSPSDLTYFQDGAWRAVSPRVGLGVYVSDEAQQVIWDGTSWTSVSTLINALSNLSELGVGTAPDSANPFAAKLNAALWTARYAAEGGSGDLRYTLNKESEAGTLSLLFQSNWSGRAELGLTGSDDVTLKVSADGAGWIDALRVDRQSGQLDVATGLRIDGAPAGAVLFTPGGAGINTIWRVDASHAELPRTATIASISDDVITLTAAVANTFARQSQWAGSSYLRIWNTSGPAETSAWMKDLPDVDAGDVQIQVTDPAHIAAWSPGDVIRLGEVAPSGVWVAAIDISPMLIQVFGASFAQTGVIVRANMVSATLGDCLFVSGTGASGDYATAVQTLFTNKTSGFGVSVIACTEPSPISNSNLVFVREAVDTTASLELVASMAVLR